MSITLKESMKTFGKKFGKLIFIFSFLTSLLLNIKSLYVNENSTINNNLNCINPVLSAETNKTEDQCVHGSYDGFTNSWEVGNYKMLEEEESLCANIFSNFLSPEIWFKNTIPTIFESVKFSYIPEVINDNNSPLLFLLGKNLKIAKIFIQENNPQLIGFEKVNIDESGFPLEREQPFVLEDPPQVGAKIDLTLRSKVIKENEVEFILNVLYISSVSGKPKEDSFEFKVLLPEANPLGKDSNIEIGVATLKGYCFKPSSFEVCE